jgi:Helicase conserved C-terminal domain
LSTPTYTDWLRARDDEELRTLVSARPELIAPVPSDLTALASRAAAPSAVARALDRLDRVALAVVEALVVLPAPADQDALARALGVAGVRGAKTAIREALGRLRELALVWNGPGSAKGDLRVAPGVRQAFTHPAGLGPSAREAFSSYPSDRLTPLLRDLGLADLDALVTRLTEPGDLIDDAGPEARTALERLAWGPPVGRVEDARRTVTLARADSPIERLLARGLLAATDDRTVALPREVALHLRDGRLFRELELRPPPLVGPVRTAELVDATAGGQAFATVRTIEELLERWGVDAPGVLRTGGLGIRDLRATAALLEVPEWNAALLIEAARAADLLAADGEWLPTHAYDLWRLQEVPQRWFTLITAWLDSDRVAGLAGGRDDRDRPINVLGDEVIRGSAPHTRRAVLATLTNGPPGTVPTPDSVHAQLAWREPRRGGNLRERLVGWTLREAEALGITGLGALATHSKVLLSPSLTTPTQLSSSAATALAKVLPTPVDHILIQADLTAVAPGPLITDLARELALAADIESTGGATVYRFTPQSVRRALDAGRSAAELIDLLKRHSMTDLPQPLSYLIEDVARRHGRLRVGSASAYARCDDPAVLDEILADRRSESLRLYRLAPTVLAARVGRIELVDALRTLGYAPVAESPEGSVLITRLDARRAEQPQPIQPLIAVASADTSMVTAAVRALRAGDEAAMVAVPEGSPPRSPAAATVDRLKEAADRGARLWIGYLDQQGQASSRIVEPARVEGGFLTAYDATRAAVQRFALHRITGVAEVE